MKPASVKAPPDYSVPALEKGLDILETMASERRSLQLSDLARLLDRNTNEIFRMVDCLARRGYLRREVDTGSYRLSLKLFELAHIHSPYEEIMRVCNGPMERLAEETGESCHLSTLSDNDLIVLAQKESRQPVRISIEVGARFPAHQTASGKLLLAAFPGKTSAKISDAMLKRIKQDGYCLDIEATRRGVMDLSVTIGSPALDAFFALTVTALRSSDEKSFVRSTLPALQKAAAAITAEAGLSL
jgi:DNA-binding IclR family transcriptional regulator